MVDFGDNFFANAGQSLFGLGDDLDAQRYRQQALDSVLGLSAPTLAQVHPELEGNSLMGGVQSDPGARAAQQQALAALMQRGNDGYGIEDRAALNNAMAEANRNAAAQRGALQQSMQARGMGNSGFAMAAQLANNQNAAQNASMAGMNAAAQSRQRALQALMAGGQMAGQVRGQSFDEAAKRAQAQDEINARNTAIKNQASYYNAQLPQQQFEDQARIAGMRAGAYGSSADAMQEQGDKKKDRAFQFGSNVIKAMSGIPKIAGVGG